MYCNISSLYFVVLRQTGRQTMTMTTMMVAMKTQMNVGYAENKVLSLAKQCTSSRMNAFSQINCQQYYTLLLRLLVSLLKCIYLPDCKNIVHHTIRHKSSWQLSIILRFSLSLSLSFPRYISDATEKEKDKCVFIYVHMYLYVCNG